MRKKLIVSDGTRERELQLVGCIVVGRDPSCEISFDDSLLSRRHAEFLTAGDVVTVRDLGSRNGLFVNGIRAAEHQLVDGDVVQIGPLRARYVIDPSRASVAPEELDAGRTAVFKRASGTTAPVPTDISAVVAALGEAFDEHGDEVTRLKPAPRMPQPAAAVPQAFSQPAAAIATPAFPPAAAESGLRAFVFVSLLALGTAIVLASLIPRLIGANGIGVALPIAIALLGTYFVGTSINRRITRALADGERNRT